MDETVPKPKTPYPQGPHHETTQSPFGPSAAAESVPPPADSRLALAGETAPETAAPVGAPKTVIRWPKSLRRDCPTKAVAQSVEIIDELIDGYKTVYRKALEGWDRSQADKEIRTVIDCPMDDAKNRRSVRTETRAGNPACLNQARGALDSIRKLLGLDLPAQVKIEEEEEEAPIELDGTSTRRSEEYVR